jgi:hypothetical protein
MTNIRALIQNALPPPPHAPPRRWTWLHLADVDVSEIASICAEQRHAETCTTSGKSASDATKITKRAIYNLHRLLRQKDQTTDAWVPRPEQTNQAIIVLCAENLSHSLAADLLATNASILIITTHTPEQGSFLAGRQPNNQPSPNSSKIVPILTGQAAFSVNANGSIDLIITRSNDELALRSGARFQIKPSND